jgi:PPP family 3-phenylpropionic acid transporter
VCVLGVVFMPIIPMVDDLTMREVSRSGSDYGLVQLWGSVAFIVTSVATGRAMDATNMPVLFPVFIAFELLAIVAVFGAPKRLLKIAGGKKSNADEIGDTPF